MTDPRRDMLPMREAQHSFDVVLRGFDRHQVAETIERLEADIRVALADRDAATVDRPHLRLQQARRRVDDQGLGRVEPTAGERQPGGRGV